MDATVARTVLLAVLVVGMSAAAAGVFPAVSGVADAVSEAIPVQEAGEMRRVIPAGGSTTISASVQNPLDIPDVLQVRFSGPAIERGYVSIEVPPGSPVRCDTEGQICETRLQGGETADLGITLRGERPGRGAMDVAVISETSGKAAHAEMFVIVTGETVVDAFWDVVDRLLGR